ncbi:RNA-directed DNA polymerase, eukaryota [Tanacetum coccineum]
MEAIHKLHDPNASSFFFAIALGLRNYVLRASLENVVTASRPGFGDWQWRLATLPIKLGGLGILSTGDIIQYAFLASRLQTSTLQTKILMKTAIESHGSSFKHALDVFNTTCNLVVLSVTTCTSAPHMMKTLAKCYFGIIEKYLVFKYTLSPRHVTILNCIRAPHAQDFLFISIDGLGQRMNHRQFRSVLCYRLVVPMFSEGSLCPSCNTHQMDQWGDHVVHCSSEVGVKFRHNLVRVILVDICSKVGIMVRKEAPMGFLSEDGKDLRSADLYYLIGSKVALHDAVKKKKRKYGSVCEENGYKFIPFAFSTFGELDTDALDTLSSSGLKINFHKSKLMGVGVNSNEVESVANLVGCSIFSSPFKYLGVIVGDNMSRLKPWEYVISKVSNRLYNWKLKTLSIGGRLTLIKSVISSIPLYHMSIFKAPIGVLNKLESDTAEKVYGETHSFWDDKWHDDGPFKSLYPRLHALETCKSISVASKLSQPSLIHSFRRPPKGGVEEEQFSLLGSRTTDISLPNMCDRWDTIIPIKVNIHAWKVFLDKLPTRLNLSLRGMDIPSILCPLCNSAAESTSHIFFSCPLARQVWNKFLRWWEMDSISFDRYEDWLSWLNNTRFPKQLKTFLEGICYIMWWLIWRFRNQVLFGSKQPRRDLLFDDIVQLSYLWISNRFDDFVPFPPLKLCTYREKKSQA